MLIALFLACTDNKHPSEPLFEGPFSYSSQYADQWHIDTLWMVTEEAEAEIAQQGQTPDSSMQTKSRLRMFPLRKGQMTLVTGEQQPRSFDKTPCPAAH